MEAGCRLRELYNNFNTLWKWLLRSSPSLAKVRARLQEKAAPERWPSGLRRTLGKRVCGKPYRGFESHSLRHSSLTSCTSKWRQARKSGLFRVFNVGESRSPVKMGPRGGWRTHFSPNLNTTRSGMVRDSTEKKGLMEVVVWISLARARVSNFQIIIAGSPYAWCSATAARGALVVVGIWQILRHLIPAPALAPNRSRDPDHLVLDNVALI